VTFAFLSQEQSAQPVLCIAEEFLQSPLTTVVITTPVISCGDWCSWRDSANEQSTKVILCRQHTVDDCVRYSSSS